MCHPLHSNMIHFHLQETCIPLRNHSKIFQCSINLTLKAKAMKTHTSFTKLLYHVAGTTLRTRDKIAWKQLQPLLPSEMLQAFPPHIMNPCRIYKRLLHPRTMLLIFLFLLARAPTSLYHPKSLSSKFTSRYQGTEKECLKVF